MMLKNFLRESMEFDVVIVGAGPSACRLRSGLKQLNADLNSSWWKRVRVGAAIFSPVR